MRRRTRSGNSVDSLTVFAELLQAKLCYEAFEGPFLSFASARSLSCIPKGDMTVLPRPTYVGPAQRCIVLRFGVEKLGPVLKQGPSTQSRCFIPENEPSRAAASHEAPNAVLQEYILDDIGINAMI